MQKKHLPSKTRTNTGSDENRNSPDSSDSSVPILDDESELIGARLSEVIGDESKRSFAKRCRMSDGLLGAYLRGEKFPGVRHLVTMADAGGVTVEWLATGRGPRTRAELRDLMDRSVACTEALGARPDKERLLMAIKMAADALMVLGEPLTAERQADLVITFYQRLTEQSAICSVPNTPQK